MENISQECHLIHNIKYTYVIYQYKFVSDIDGNVSETATQKTDRNKPYNSHVKDNLKNSTDKKDNLTQVNEDRDTKLSQVNDNIIKDERINISIIRDSYLDKINDEEGEKKTVELEVSQYLRMYLVCSRRSNL